MAISAPGGDTGLGEVLAQAIVGIAQTWILRWTPNFYQKVEGVCTAAQQAEGTSVWDDHIATVDLGDMTVRADWCPNRFAPSDLTGKRVRILWDSHSPIRILDDVVA
jgi:hypothetical protein